MVPNGCFSLPVFWCNLYTHKSLLVQAHHQQLLQCGLAASVTKLSNMAWLRPTSAASAQLHCATAGWLLHAIDTEDGLAGLGGAAGAVGVITGLLKEAIAADRCAYQTAAMERRWKAVNGRDAEYPVLSSCQIAEVQLMSSRQDWRMRAIASARAITFVFRNSISLDLVQGDLMHHIGSKGTVASNILAFPTVPPCIM